MEEKTDFPQNEIIDQLTKKVARGGGITFGGQIFSKAVSFVFTVLITNVLGAKSYGLYSLSLVVISVAKQISTLGLGNGVIRFVSLYSGENDQKRVKGTIITALIIPTTISIVAAILLFLFSGTISKQVFNDPALTNVLRVFSLSLPFYIVMSMALFSTRGFQTMRYSVLTNNFFQPIANIILVSTAFLLGYKLYGLIIGLIISAVLSALLACYFLKKLFPPILSDVKSLFPVRRLLRFSIPLFFAGFTYFFLVRTDILMLGYFLGSKDVGLYNVARRVSATLPLILGSFNAIFAPIISDLYNRGKTEILKKLFKTTTRWTFTLSLPLFLVVVLFARDIMVIFGSEFAISWTVLIVLAFSQLVNFSVGGAGFMLQMSGKQDLILINNLALVIINFGLNILLIRSYGLIGAAIATTISLAIINFVKLVQVYRHLGMHPYSRKFMKPVIACFGALLFHIFIQGFDLFWLIECILSGIIYFAILYALKLDEEDLMILKAIKRRVLK